MRRHMMNGTFPLLILLFASGCATPIKTKALEANKHKTFSVGIVKASGGIPWITDNVERKKDALQKIPVEEICGVLSTELGLTIKTNIDRTIRTVVEKPEGQFRGPLVPTVNSAYFGNHGYVDAGRLLGAFRRKSREIGKGRGDLIYITYKLNPPSNPFSFKDEFGYELLVVSDKEVLLDFRGVVARVPTPMNGPIADLDGMWNNFAAHAAGIPEALTRDIQEARKKE